MRVRGVHDPRLAKESSVSAILGASGKAARKPSARTTLAKPAARSLSKGPEAGVAVEISLGQRVYAQLREEIITCELAPGASFSEGQLAARCGVGKAPVRWALAALTREELVIPKARQGYLIAPITVQSVRDLFDLRAILEPAAARLAAGRMTRAHLEGLEQSINRARAHVGKDRRGEFEFLRANTAFHKEIAVASGNARLARVLAVSMDESERIFFVSMPRWGEMQGDHRAIVDALVTGNGVEAEKLALMHVQHAYKIILDGILERIELQSLSVGQPR